MTKLKILIIDNITKEVNKFSSTLDELSLFTIHNSTKFQDCINYFDNNKYEYIIIDHSIKDADELMDYILTKSANQKIILLSDTLNCPVKCTFCLDNFQFVRLLKPIKIIEVIEYIQNKIEFSCPNQYRFENLDSVEKIYDLLSIEDFSFYKQKEIIDESLYFRPEESSNLNQKELDKILNLVNHKTFKSKVMKDFSIKVEKKI